MSRHRLVVDPLLTWLLAGTAIQVMPKPALASTAWRYLSVDFPVFLVLWTLCFHFLFRSAVRGMGGLAELPLPITHRNRLRYAIPAVSGILLLLFLFSQAPAYTAFGTLFFGGREVRHWIRKRKAGFSG